MKLNDIIRLNDSLFVGLGREGEVLEGCVPCPLPDDALSRLLLVILFKKVDIRLPRQGNSNSHGARPVHLIISMIKWIRTSRLSIKNSLPGVPCPLPEETLPRLLLVILTVEASVQREPDTKH